MQWIHSEKLHSQRFHHLCITRSLSIWKSNPTSTGWIRQLYNLGNIQNSNNSFSENTSFTFLPKDKIKCSLEYSFNEIGKCVETTERVLLDYLCALHCSAQWCFWLYCGRINASKTLLNVKHINITLHAEDEIITLFFSMWSSQQRPKAWPKHQYVCVCVFVTLSDTNTHLISTACIPLDVF